MVLGKQDMNKQNHEVRSLPHTKYKNSLNMNQTANIHSKSMKILEENIGVNLSDLWIGRDLLAITPKAEGKKERYTGFCQIKKKKKCVLQKTISRK